MYSTLPLQFNLKGFTSKSTNTCPSISSLFNVICKNMHSMHNDLACLCKIKRQMYHFFLQFSYLFHIIINKRIYIFLAN